MTMMGDPDLFRAAFEYIGTMTPVQTVLERPDVQQRIAGGGNRGDEGRAPDAHAGPGPPTVASS